VLRPLLSVLTAALLVGGGIGLSSGAPVEPLASDAGPCVTHSQEARPTGYGYRHVVIIRNACKKAMSCEVSSDVNPEVQVVSVPPGETREVVTFLEAPGSGFTARVSCK
jgi:hypothetical protein